MHIMIDLETMGIRPTAAILQIGAVAFEPVTGGRIDTGRGFNKFIALQDGAGTIDNGTLAFWLKQPLSTKLGENIESADTLEKVLHDFEKWPYENFTIRWEDVQGVWAWPSNFDLAILSHAYSLLGKEPPWKHWTTRCARTIWNFAGCPKVDDTGLKPHDAFDDAVYAAQAVQKSMAVLAG